MRLDHLPPGRQARLDAGLRVPGHGASGTAALLVELEAQQFLVELAYLVGLSAGGDGLQQALNRVKPPEGVVGGEALVVCPRVTYRLQLRDVAAVGAGQLPGEDRVPLVPQHLQQELWIAGVDLPGPAAARRLGPLHCSRPVGAERRLALAGHERRQSLAQQRYRLADPLVVAQCHVVTPVRAPARQSATGFKLGASKVSELLASSRRPLQSVEERPPGSRHWPASHSARSRSGPLRRGDSSPD